MSDNNTISTLIPAQFPGAFCGDAVSSQVATVLCRSEELIRQKGEAQTEAVRAIGRELIAVKDLLPLDEFGPWLRREFDMAEETAGAYMAAAQKIAADPARDKKMMRPKLIRWHPDGESGACGYADIELPSGIKLDGCAAFGGGPAGPCLELRFPRYIQLSNELDIDEFEKDIIAQILEVDPGAFGKNHQTATAGN